MRSGSGTVRGTMPNEPHAPDRTVDTELRIPPACAGQVDADVLAQAAAVIERRLAERASSWEPDLYAGLFLTHGVAGHGRPNG